MLPKMRPVLLHTVHNYDSISSILLFVARIWSWQRPLKKIGSIVYERGMGVGFCVYN